MYIISHYVSYFQRPLLIWRWAHEAKWPTAQPFQPVVWRDGVARAVSFRTKHIAVVIVKQARYLVTRLIPVCKVY